MTIQTMKNIILLSLAMWWLFVDGRAMALEPPMQCAIKRGAWCIISSNHTITYSGVHDEPRYQWHIAGDYWKDEPALILESKGCRDAVADDNQIVETNSEVTWEGKRWREVVVRLRKDGTCELRLLAPTFDQVELDAAASRLSTNIAVCFAHQPCEQSSISSDIYRTFRSLR